MDFYEFLSFLNLQTKPIDSLIVKWRILSLRDCIQLDEEKKSYEKSPLS